MFAQPLPPAHESWFVHHPEAFPLQWSELLRLWVVIGLVAVVVVAVLWRLAARRLPQPELPGLRPLARLIPWVPRLLAIHLGLSLLLLAVDRSVLDPGVTVGPGLSNTLLLVPEVIAAILLITGFGVPLAAWMIIAAGPVLLLLSGPQSLLTGLVLLGIAGFLLAVPPESALGGRAKMDSARSRTALLFLRVGTAGTLLTLAVVEKLANPAMAAAMLKQQPILDVLSPLGIGPQTFAVIAGCVEVLFALLLLSGAIPQVVALVAAVPFTASLLVFGGTELVGHLPVYGILLTVLVLGSSPRTSRELSWIPRHDPASATPAREHASFSVARRV